MGFMVLRVWLDGEFDATRLQTGDFERQIALIQITDCRSMQFRTNKPMGRRR